MESNAYNPYYAPNFFNRRCQCRFSTYNGTFIRNDSLYNQMEEGIFQRYEKNKPDYLVLIGSIAFTLRDRIQKEWGDIPMILIANEDTYAPGNITSQDAL